MAEDSTIILNSDDQSLGKIQIAPRVIEIIAGIAANEIDGVSKMHGSLANNVGLYLTSFVRYGSHNLSLLHIINNNSYSLCISPSCNL